MVGLPAPIAMTCKDLRLFVASLFLSVFGIGMIGHPVTPEANELHDAVRIQDHAAIKALVAAGVDVDESDYILGSPLHLATSVGDTRIVAALIDHGADLESGSEINGMRALHIAAQSGDTPMVRLLVDRGCDIEAHDGLQRTPLIVAAIEGHMKVARQLLGRGAAVDGRDGIKDRTPLMMASYFGRLETVKLLIEHDANVNATDSFNETSLSFAVGDASYRNAGGPSLIEYLLANGADPYIRRKDGLTPLGYAKVRGFKEQAGVLRGLGVTE